MADKKNFEIIVLHGSPLRGDCLTRTLASELGAAVRGMRSVDEFVPAANSNVSLVILDIGEKSLNDPAAREDINRIRALAPLAAVAVISDQIDLTQAFEATSLGLKGFISSTEKFDIVVAAVRLILAGGKYCSNATELTFCRDAQSNDADAALPVRCPTDTPANGRASGPEPAAPTFPAPSKFTSREAQVLKYLQQGFPNKAIANELRLSENTVKVHVRRIMRKLSVKNRTEAALSYRRIPLVHPANRGDQLRSLSVSRQVLLQFRKDVP